MSLVKIILKDKFPKDTPPAWIIKEIEKRKKEKYEQPQLPLYLPEIPDYDYNYKDKRP